MAKFTKYLLITAMLLVMFNFLGIIPDEESPLLLQMMKNPHLIIQNTNFSSGWDLLQFLTLLGGAAGVGFAIYYKDLSIAAMSAMIPIITGWLTSIFYVYNAFGSAPAIITSLIISPFILMAFISIIDWWRSPLA